MLQTDKKYLQPLCSKFKKKKDVLYRIQNFIFQVRFLTEQGIEHLVTLSPEKIPPHYAFPDLQHTLIPVEDFTGPTIAEIQKFIEITDEARKEGMAVGVHCAEGNNFFEYFNFLNFFGYYKI